jgi:hypothetical protein
VVKHELLLYLEKDKIVPMLNMKGACTAPKNCDFRFQNISKNSAVYNLLLGLLPCCSQNHSKEKTRQPSQQSYSGNPANLVFLWDSRYSFMTDAAGCFLLRCCWFFSLAVVNKIL